MGSGAGALLATRRAPPEFALRGRARGHSATRSIVSALMRESGKEGAAEGWELFGEAAGAAKSRSSAAGSDRE